MNIKFFHRVPYEMSQRKENSNLQESKVRKICRVSQSRWAGHPAVNIQRQ